MRRDPLFIAVIILLFSLAFVGLLSLYGCTDPTRSENALRNAGYTDIEMTGWQPFACGGDDTFTTGFKAVNPAGDHVSGVVCCGLAKGCTIRF